MRFPLSWALASAGSNKAAKMAIMAITTRSSIKVKAASLRLFIGWKSSDILASFLMHAVKQIQLV